MNSEIHRQLLWVQLYQQTGDAGLVYRRCGISRPTLRKWVRRFHEAGEAGLLDRSRRPLRSPNRRVFEKERLLILRLRAERKLGARRIQSEEPRPSRRGFCKPRGNVPPLRYGLPFNPALPSGASWQILVKGCLRITQVSGVRLNRP
jgi:transposase-like protein